MITTFQETLAQLDSALERSRKRDEIDRRVASLSMRGLACQISGDFEGLKKIVIDLETLQAEIATLA